MRVFHQIHAGASRCLPEELPAQPPVKRSRIGDEKQLGHAGHILKQFVLQCQSNRGFTPPPFFTIDSEHTHDTV